MSEVFYTCLGVPQGAVLSPTLFLMFIDDLLSTTSNTIHSYADDSTLHASSSFRCAPRTIDRAPGHVNISESVTSDLGRIDRWGLDNRVAFNSNKTQLLPISLAHEPPDFRIFFEGERLLPSDSINILGVSIDRKMSWRPHIASLTRAAAMKMGALYRIRNYFSPAQLKRIYVGSIRPVIEYCSHIWGGCQSTSMLASIDRRACRLIGSPVISDSLDSLVLRRTVGTLALFYRYYHGECSVELAACVPPLMPPPPRPTRLALARHPLSIVEFRVRTVRYECSFFPSAVRLWNSLPPDVFPPGNTFAPGVFRSRVSNYYRSLPPHTDAGWGYLVI
jgi:hypothetical protein